MQLSREQISPPTQAEPSNLFAGLSFPDVPTSLIVPRQRPLAHTALSSSVGGGGGGDAGAIAAPLPSSAAEDMQGTEMVSMEGGSSQGTVASAPQAPVVQAIMQSTSLASLYAPVPVATRNYPDISGLSRGGGGQLRVVDDSEERVGLLHQAPQASGNAAASREIEAEAANASLIHDLMMENARLAEENARLLREKAASDQAAARSPATSSSSSSTTSYHGPTIVSGPPLSYAPTSAVGSHLSAPAQGVRISGSTPPAQREGVKYVCCGTCRQWLLAPRDATYVFCPQCRCINNCGNMPASQPQQPQQQSQYETGMRAGPVMDRPETWELPPYFRDCFRGVWR